MKKYIMTGLAFAMSHTAWAPAAWADNVAHCEVLLVKNVEDAGVDGALQVTDYRPAVDFIASVYDDEPEYQTQIEGHNIQALLCRRNELIPAETDYPMMATGVPFVLSQDFDSTDTDSLTLFWKDGAFDYVYKGYPLSDEAQTLLEERLADFTERGLIKKSEPKTETEDQLTASVEDTDPIEEKTEE